MVRSFYLDMPATERIAVRARALREAAGTLTGHAADLTGETARDVLADVLAVFGSNTGLQWDEAAARLASRFPGRWADASGEAVSAECRGRGVASVNVKSGRQVAKGCRRADVEAAAGGR